MARSNLVLLGTIHSDPLGFKRLRTFLSLFDPDLILVEVSPFALEYRQANSARLLRELRMNLRQASRNLKIDLRVALKHPRIKAIMRQFTVPFEYRAAVSHAAREGTILVIPVDSSDFSRQWIQKWSELISVQNLQTLLDLDCHDVPEWQRYEQAARSIRGRPGPIEFRSPEDIRLWQEREDQLAANTKAALDRYRTTRPLYVGGWTHLVAGCGMRSLRSILRVDLARCFLLDRGSLVSGS